MANFFRHPDRRQRFLLLPIDMMDWVPKDDIVHLIVDAVEMMDLRRFEESYATSGPGQAPFSPAMMLALLIYAYSNKVRSSRKIEQLCRRDAGFRLIVGDAVPDHTVIARFRRRHATDMEALFVEVLKLCREAGLLRLGVIALDGTKIKANAALDANRTARSLAEEVAAVFAEAEAVDAAEDVLSGERRGDVLPAALADAGSRKARLAACREKLAAKAAETAARQQQKIDARAGEERAAGRSKRGRKPKPADDSVDPAGRPFLAGAGVDLLLLPGSRLGRLGGQLLPAGGKPRLPAASIGKRRRQHVAAPLAREHVLGRIDRLGLGEHRPPPPRRDYGPFGWHREQRWP